MNSGIISPSSSLYQEFTTEENLHAFVININDWNNNTTNLSMISAGKQFLRLSSCHILLLSISSLALVALFTKFFLPLMTFVKRGSAPSKWHARNYCYYHYPESR